MLDDETMSQVHYAYFNREVIVNEGETYTDDKTGGTTVKDYGWNHPLTEVLTPLLKQGLQLKAFQEFDYSPYDCFENTVEVAPGQFQIKGQEGKLPMVYALHMHLPA